MGIRHNLRLKVKHTIDWVVNFEQMQDIVNYLKLSHNDVFCGYLRQPIDINIYQDENQEPTGDLSVQGICSLEDCICYKVISPETGGYVGPKCTRYREYFREHKNE